MTVALAMIHAGSIYMASDSLLTCRGVIEPPQSKLHSTGKLYIAWAGDFHEWQRMKRFFDGWNNFKAGWWVKFQFAVRDAILEGSDKDKLWLLVGYFCNAHPYLVSVDPLGGITAIPPGRTSAIGAGEEFAIGAMHAFGQDPSYFKRAVEICIRCHNTCGGDIMTAEYHK